jgi:hypothetical protein
MYTGGRDGLVDWFRGIGFEYDAARHGVVSDWALDLVAVGSHKPGSYYGQTITRKQEVRTLSAHFVGHWLGQRGEEEEKGAAGKGGWQAESPVARIVASGFSSSSSGSGGSSAARDFGPAGLGSRGPSSSHHSSPRHGARSPHHPAPHQQRAREEATLREPSTWLQQYRWTFTREFCTVTRNPVEVAGRVLTNSW